MLATAEIVAKARQKVLAAAQAGEHSQEVIDGAAQAQAKLEAARTDVAVLGGVRGPFTLEPDGLTVLDGLMHVLDANSTVDQPSATPLRLVVLALEEPVVGEAVAEEPEVAPAKLV